MIPFLTKNKPCKRCDYLENKIQRYNNEIASIHHPKEHWKRLTEMIYSNQKDNEEVEKLREELKQLNDSNLVKVTSELYIRLIGSQRNIFEYSLSEFSKPGNWSVATALGWIIADISHNIGRPIIECENNKETELNIEPLYRFITDCYMLAEVIPGYFNHLHYVPISKSVILNALERVKE